MKQSLLLARPFLIDKLTGLSYFSVASNTILMSMMLLTRMVCQGVVLTIIVRMLGADGYGIFAAVVALGMVFAQLSGLGSDFLALRAVAQLPNIEKRVFHHGAMVIIATGIPLIILVTILAHWWLPESVSLALIITVLVADMLAVRFTELVAKIYQGRERFPRMGMVRLLVPLARLMAAVSVWLLPIKVTPLVWAQFYLVGSLFASAVACIWIMADYSQSDMETARAPHLSLLDGLHFAGGIMSVRFHTEADKTLVLMLSTAAGAGIYAAAYRIVEFAFMPMIALTSVLYGRLFHHALHNDLGAVTRLGFMLLAPCVAMSLVMAVLLWWLLVPTMTWLLGAEFAGVQAGLLPLVLLPLSMSIRLVGDQSMAAMGRLPLRSRIQWPMAMSALASNLIFIPVYGWTAAAWICLGIELLLGLVYFAVIGKAAVKPRGRL